MFMNKKAMNSNKSVLAIVMICVLSFIVSPVTTNAEPAMGNVSDELFATASFYMNNIIAVNLSKENYTPSYNDVMYAMYCIKAGATNDTVMEKLDDYVESEVVNYAGSGFMGSYSGVNSYALASAVLYLQERQQDVTNYNGKNIVKLMTDSYMTENNINPYAHQLVIGALDNALALGSDLSDTDVTAVKTKVKNEVLASYVSGESGTGIDYWGVSVDNNGQVLPALLEYYNIDSDITLKINAAIEWNESQTDETGAVVFYGSPSVDSTALALKLSAQTGKIESAHKFYNALAQFKSSTNGAYKGYSGDADVFSTGDALIGLLAYNNQMEEKSFLAVKNADAGSGDADSGDNSSENNGSDENGSGNDFSDNNNSGSGDKDDTDGTGNDSNSYGYSDIIADNADDVRDKDNEAGNKGVDSSESKDESLADGTDNAKVPESPRTADMNIIFYAVVMIGAGLALAGTKVYAKKCKN